MKRNEICYVAIVVIIGASLLLGFAEEVFHTDPGGLKWAAHWVSSPVALAIGFAFALLMGKPSQHSTRPCRRSYCNIPSSDWALA